MTRVLKKEAATEVSSSTWAIRFPPGGDLVIAPVTLMRLHPHPVSPSSYSSLTSPPSCPIIFTNLLPLKPSWNYNNQQNVFHAWLQYIKDFWKISNHSETLQKLLKRFRNKLWTPVLKCDQQWLTTVKPHGRAAHESPPVISFWTANKLITGSSSSHPIVSPTSLLVTPWTRRPTERLEGVVVDAGGEFLPTRSRIVSSSDKSEFKFWRESQMWWLPQYILLIETVLLVVATVMVWIQKRPNLEQGRAR